MEQKVNDVLKKLDEKKNVINMLKEEKGTCEMVVCDFQKKYNDILQQCTILEDKVGHYGIIYKMTLNFYFIFFFLVEGDSVK